MSFFANLLGGTLQGVGSGMSSMAADEERLAREKALIQERSQAALDLQQQRAQDRLDQQQQMMQMRAELGGGAGGGGGGKGLNLAAMAMQAKTPEEQDRLVNITRAFNNNAGMQLADVGFGRPVMTGVAPSAGDFARYDRAGDMEAAPPKTTMERASYDRQQGETALQRTYTLWLDPGKLDDHAKGERQFGLNDMGAANANQVMQRGGSLPEASAAFQRFSGTKDESGKEDLAQQRIDATRERTAATGANSAANRASQEARALDKQITAESKLLADATKEEKVAIKARITALQARRAALDDDGPAPAPAIPARTITKPAPAESAKSRADAWKQKFGG